MSKKEIEKPRPVEDDQGNPMLPVMLIGVLAIAIIALALKAFGVF